MISGHRNRWKILSGKNRLYGRLQFKRERRIVEDRERSRGLSKNRTFEDRLGEHFKNVPGK